MTALARATIQRASADDVTELLCDTTGTSMQVGAVLVLDAALEPADVRVALAARVLAVPRLRQTLRPTPFGCGRPVWCDDPAFDIARHVSSLSCARPVRVAGGRRPDPVAANDAAAPPVRPGSQHDLLDLAAQVIAERLPADRPLWSATLITGLADGRCALVVVFHHILTDGIGGLAVLARLVDGEPARADPDFPRSPARALELLGDSLRSRFHALAGLPSALGRLRAATVELGVNRPRTAPRSSLNRPVGTGRALRVAGADTAAVLTAARAQGGTLNDAVVTAAAGALRTVLARRGERIEELVFSLPVSARRSTSATDLGNQVGVIPVAVPTCGAPAARLAAVAAITRARKTADPGSSAALLGPVFRILARLGVFGWFINRQHLVNSFVTNLRGPTGSLTFLGAEVVDVIAVPMITGNVSVAFAALSYAGHLTVTIVADPERCPDLTELAAAVQLELDELTAAQLVAGLPAVRSSQGRDVRP